MSEECLLLIIDPLLPLNKERGASVIIAFIPFDACVPAVDRPLLFDAGPLDCKIPHPSGLEPQFVGKRPVLPFERNYFKPGRLVGDGNYQRSFNVHLRPPRSLGRKGTY